MNRQQFSELVKDPGTLAVGTIAELESLLRQYPYCMTAQVLLAMNLHGQSHTAYPQQLKKAVAYAGDRKKLKELLEGKKQLPVLIITEESAKPLETYVPTGIPETESSLPEVTVSSAEPASFLQQVPEQKEIKQENFIEDSLISPEELELATPQLPQGKEDVEGFVAPAVLVSRPAQVSIGKVTQDDLLAIVRKRLAEISEEKKGKEPGAELSTLTFDVHQSNAVPKLPVDPNKSKDELIERFIREEPQISRPRKEFFNPASSSHRSNMDEEDIVTETLALLYAQQGNMQKAIHIYEKLSLRFSEKSRYFAAQIENLKGNQQQ